jgi:integrase
MPRRSTEPAMTDKRLRSLVCPEGEKFHEFRDPERRNFFVRVYAGTGLKVFFYRYRSPYPKGVTARKRPMRSMKLGSYPDELGLAGVKGAVARIDGMVASGVDPQGPPQAGQKGASRPGRTAAPVMEEGARGAQLAAILGAGPVVPGSFADLARRYLLQHVWPTFRRPREVETAVAQMCSAWRDEVASSIRKGHAKALINQWKMRDKMTAARRMRTYIGMVFNWGIGEDLFDDGNRLEVNPASGIRDLGRERRRTDYLRDEEIATFWQACEARSNGYGITSAALQLLLVLVQRPGEVYQMRWAEIRGEWWQIPGGKTGRTKNELEHRVFLAPLALEILERLRSAGNGGEFVFPSPRLTDGSPVTVTGMSSVYNDICRAAGIACEPKPWGPHGLRRTGSTKLSELGFSDEIVDAVTNHVKRGVRRNYNLNAYLPEKQRAMMAWEGHLRSIIAAG